MINVFNDIIDALQKMDIFRYHLKFRNDLMLKCQQEPKYKLVF